MLPGKHVPNQNAQCLQIVFLTAIPMSVSSSVFASFEQFIRTASARFLWCEVFNENMWHIFQSNRPHGCPCEWSIIRHMKRHEENPDKIFRTQSVRNCYKKNNIKFWNKDWDLYISHHSKWFQNLAVAWKRADSKYFSIFLDNPEDFLVKVYSLGNYIYICNLHIQGYKILLVSFRELCEKPQTLSNFA